MCPAGGAYAVTAQDFALTVNALLIRKPLRGHRITLPAALDENRRGDYA
jgi:hypothetical protein